MWSIKRTRRFDGLSIRRITLFASAILVALFASLTVISTSVKAQAPAMATWSGENLEYKEADWGSAISLTKSDSPENDENIPDLNGTDCQDNPHIFYSSPGSLAGQDTARLYIICLGSPFDGSDKSQPIPAMFIQFSAPPGTTDPSQFGDPGRVSITIAPEGVDGSGNPTDATITSCDSRYTRGLGWIICPVTNWLAAGMDSLFNILVGFLSVPPLTTDRDGPLYYMWGLMRNAANMLFIAGFLVIIYSQITGAGISNYGIKRLMPRLILAAVLVNTSYWITALAVDLSNVFGVELQNLLVGIRENIPLKEASSFDASELTWEAVATTVLTGSAAGIFGVGSAVASIGATAGGSLWLLLVGLAGVMLSVLVAILVLAARQALITVLIIIAPLAFVAYLLPATESYFNRWRSLLTTMLVMFPMFSLIFGGSQLAGFAIIHSADPESSGFFTIIILGMIVQVAPIIITPLLIKLSGSLLGRVAGFVNNPNRGIIDQTRKFAEGRRDGTKYRQLYDKDRHGNYKNKNPLAEMGRWNARREMSNANKLKTWQSGAEALWAQDNRSHEVHRQSAINEMIKSEGESVSKAEFAREVANRNALKRLYTQQEVSKEDAEHAASLNKTVLEIGRTKPVDEKDVALRALYSQANKLYEDAHMETERQSRITKKQEEDFYDKMDKDVAMQNYAGATVVDDYGDLRAKVTAQTKLMAASSERVKNYEQSFLFDNIDKDTALKKATRDIYTNDEEWEAAINYVFESKDTDNIIKLHEQIKLTKDTPAGIRQAFELAAKKSPTKPIFATAGRLGDLAQGKRLRDDGDGDKLTTEWQLEAVEKGKYGTADLVQKASKEEIMRLTRVLREIKAAGGKLEDHLSADAISRQRDRVRDVFKDPRMYTHLGDNEVFMVELGKELGLSGNDFNPKTK